MNLNHLRIFHAVAETGSVTAAARRLRVSQPAVSKQLGELETALGVHLVDRLPRGVRLTRAGRSLAEHAERLFAIEREAELEMEKWTEDSRRVLSVGASTTIGSYLAPSLFGEFRRLHPDVALSLEIENTSMVYEMVREDRVDLGLVEGLQSEEDLLCSPFAEDELVAVTAPGDPLLAKKELQLAQIAERPFLMRERGSGTREVLEAALLARGVEVQIEMELGSIEALKNAVASRLGIAFLSSLALDHELGMGRLSRLVIQDFSVRRQLQVVELRHREISPLVQSFKQLLGKSLARRPRGEYSI